MSKMPHSVAATDHLQANTGMSAHLHLISILHFQVESQCVIQNAAPSSPAILCEVATARLDYAYDHQTTFAKTFASFLPSEQHSAVHYCLPVGCVHHPFASLAPVVISKIDPQHKQFYVNLFLLNPCFILGVPRECI
jgi:hypothetical protein